jgi:hypothetical protein
MWYLIALIWLALVVGIVWAYGKKRRRASSERARELDALIAEAKLNARAATDPQPVAVAAAAPAPVVVAAAAWLRKPRLLVQSDALLYLLLRTGLPDHEVFANLTLADVVEPAAELHGFEREQLARKLAQYRLNMVVCNKQLEIVAVVTTVAGTPAGNADGERYVEACLNGAGIRLVRLDAAALPRHQQVRALVCGDTPPPAA